MNKSLLLKRIFLSIIILIFTGGAPLLTIAQCTLTSNDDNSGTGELIQPVKTWLVGNSFTACQDGILSKVKVLVLKEEWDDFSNISIEIYEGNGIGGIKLGTKTGNALHNATTFTDYSEIDVSGLNIPVTSGNQYTFWFPDYVKIYARTANMYSGGTYWVDNDGVVEITNRDLYFEIDIIESASNSSPTASSFTTSSGPYTNNVYTFSTSDFGYSDGDYDPINHVRITAIPGSGMLYVDADNGDDYDSGEELSNNAQVSKANLDAGNLQFYTISSSGTSFTFDVNDGTDYSALTYTATISVSDLATTTYSGTGSWSNKANWSPGIPGTTTDVTIAGTCTVDAGYEVADMTINSGAVVSVDPGNVLTVSGTLINSAGTTGLIVRSDAGLITKSSVSGTVEKYITQDVWHYIGVPISYVSDINNILHGFYVYSIDETNAINGSSSGWTEMAAGDYMIYSYGYAVQYNSPSDNDTTIAVSGTLATGTINRAIFRTNEGWNLIANLYPCTIDWSIIDDNLTNKAVYVYNGATYDSWNNGIANGHTQYLAPMQGFFVEAATSETVSYTNSAKTSTPSTFKSANIDPVIQLTLTQDDEHFDRTTITVNKYASMNFDGSMDAHKLMANAGYSEFYTSYVQEKFSINAIPEITEDMIIPLTVMCEITGEHKLALSELKAFNYPYPVVLFDENKNKIAELENEDYIFDGQKDEVKTFYIGFRSVITSSPDILQNDIQVFNGNHAVVIKGLGSRTSNISIYNLSGAKILERITSSNELTIPLSLSGVYIVKVIPERGNVVTQKVFIN